MDYKYKLTEELKAKASQFNEFANGAAQVTVLLRDGRKFYRAVISNSEAIIAMRGFKSLPFSIDEIADISQTEEDKNPSERENFEFWDKWT